MVVGHDGRLAYHGGMLQITVGDGPRRVGVRHKRGSNFWWKGVSPKVRMAIGVVVYPAHVCLGGVGGAGKGREFGNDLSLVRGLAAQASGQRSEGIEVPQRAAVTRIRFATGAIEG